MRKHSHLRYPVTAVLACLFAGWTVTSGDALGGDDGKVTVQLKPVHPIMPSLVSYYRPIRVVLTEKPAEELDGEPSYVSPRPLYGTIPVGTGDDQQITVVVDEPEEGPPRIFVDGNNDEDLSNDGPGDLSRSDDDSCARLNVVVQIPYDSESVPYAIDLYRFKRRLRDSIFCHRNSGREGLLTSGEKAYKIVLLDDNADGRFDDLENGAIIIDLNGDGELGGNPDSAEHHRLAEPFNIYGRVWEVDSVAADGRSLTIRPSEAEVAMRPYLQPGCTAPSFSARNLAGDPVALESDDDTKYVLLDFWAAWCGPCRQEFPHLRKLHVQYKDHGLKIIGVNMDSEREEALKAIQKESLDYTHLYDGKRWQNDVAVLYRVHRIPQTFLLDKDLKIVAKGLRGTELEQRMRQLLGPGAIAAADSLVPRDVRLTQLLGAKRLVHFGRSPGWSPDGTELAFGKPRNAGVQIVNVETGQIRNLVPTGKDPVWSPDGRFIAFVRETRDDGQAKVAVWLVTPDGKSQRKVAPGGYPRWSADGKRLFIRSRPEAKIVVAHLDNLGSAPEDFYVNPQTLYPAVSPDETRIAFGRANVLHIVDRKTRQTVLSVPVPGSRGLLPAWSPDGKYVGFGGFDNSRAGLWVADVAGRRVALIAKGAYTLPCWSADGKKLAFDFRPRGAREVWYIDTEKFDSLPWRPIPALATRSMPGTARPPAPVPGPAIDTKAPEIEGNDTESVPFRLSNYLGQVVVLDFWGDW